MPRTVFSLLWKTVQSCEEFMGHVKNLCKDGSYYWIYATVTPSYEPIRTAMRPEIIGYFSVRRKPDKTKLALIQDLYRDMLAAEQIEDRRDAVTAINKADDPAALKILNESFMSLINAKRHQSTQDVVDGFLLWECDL